jgi:thiol-disulfide isomerase/thioredoxin
MKSLIRLFSYNSYAWVALAVGAGLAATLARGGLTWLEAVGLAAYAAAAYLGYRWWKTPRQKLAQFDALAAFDKVLRDNRPTLVEFYSDNCGVCMTMRPVMDRLEGDAQHRLQVLRVDVKDSVGAQLADRYAVTFTPTFMLFNSNGSKEEEYTLVLDRARVLYWLDQQTISP